MNVAKLQGTPWHYEQMKKVCRDGSKYCIYNHKVCSNKECKVFHKNCIGKGNCDWFEPKTGTPKVYSQKTLKIQKIKNEEKKMNNKNNSTPILNEKHKKFLDTAEKRVNDIILKVEGLENLSNKNNYEYTTEEVEKMFSSIEETLKTVKQSFLNKNRTRFKF